MVTCALAALVAGALAATMPASDDVIHSATTVSRITLEVLVPRCTPLGQPIPLSLCLKNESGVELWTPNRELTFAAITVIRWDGKPVKTTAEGLWLHQNADAGAVLAPGKDSSRQIDLHRCFDLGEAGVYAITVKRDVALPSLKTWRWLDVAEVRIIVGPDVGPPLPD
jgi:hypothetical protein